MAGSAKALVVEPSVERAGHLLTSRSVGTVGEAGPHGGLWGTLRLTGATIRGTLNLVGLDVGAPDGRSCIAAQGATVDGDVELHRLSAVGGKLNFRAATVGGEFDARAATLHHPDGLALTLQQATVRGSVRLVDEFRSTGRVRLNRVTVDGGLDCTGATLICPHPTTENRRGIALEAYSATVRGGMHLAWARVEPEVNLTGALTSTLADDLGNWPERYTLTGFTYERFAAVRSDRSALAWDGAARRGWLRRQQEFDAGAYEQAARVFRQHGYQREAEDLLIAQRRDAARAVARHPGTSRFGSPTPTPPSAPPIPPATSTPRPAGLSRWPHRTG